jgi:hypothetical protein
MTASGNQNDVRGWAFDDNIILFAGKSSNGTTSILSTDGGATWTAVSGLVNTDVKWMQGDKNKTIAMASTNVGPYLFDLATKTWVDAAGDIETGAPYFDGKWGAYNPNTNTFRFSTWGFGIWDFEVSDGTPKLTVQSNIPSTVKRGDVVQINWTTNQSGTVVIDLMRNANKVSTLASVSHTTKPYNWTVGQNVAFGSDYSIRVSIGGVQASTLNFAIFPELVKIDQKNIAIESFNSQGNTTTEAAKNVLDGDISTIWHTSYASNAPTFPHEIVFKVNGLFGSDTLQAFSYTSRTNADNGKIKDFDLFTSLDKVTWTKMATGSFENTGLEELVLFSGPVIGKNPLYVKFVAKSEIDNQSFASMAEFNLYKYGSSKVANKKNSLATNLLGVEFISATIHSLELKVPSAGNYQVQLMAANGKVLVDQRYSLGAGFQNISLNLGSMNSQVAILSVQGNGTWFNQRISIK